MNQNFRAARRQRAHLSAVVMFAWCVAGCGPSGVPAPAPPPSPRDAVDAKLDEFERHLDAIDLIFRDIDTVPPADAARKSVAADEHITAMGAIVNSLKTAATTDAQNDRFARLLPRAQAHMKKNVEVSRRLKGGP
jgi:hypothetical protein